MPKHRTCRTAMIVTTSLALVVLSIVGFRSKIAKAQQTPVASDYAESSKSPLDSLNPQVIPAAERANLPSELVAIVGSNRGRHTEPAKCIAISSNGKLVASGSRDGSVRLWDPETLQERAKLQHPDDVDMVMFSPDSTKLYSICWDGKLRIWNVANKPELAATIQLEPARTEGLLEPSTGLIVTSGESSLHVRKLENGELKEAHDDLKGFEFGEAMESLDLSADGRWLAAGCWNEPSGRVYIWDLKDPSSHPARILSDPERRISSVRFTSDPKLLLVGRDDGVIVLWNLDGAEPQKTKTLKGHDDDILAMIFSADGKSLISGGGDHRICVWEWRNADSKLIDTLKKHDGRVTALAMSPDGRTMYSASWDHSVRRWMATRGSFESNAFDGHSYPVAALAFSTDGSRLATGALADIVREVPNEVRMWRFGDAQPKLEKILPGCKGSISSLSFSHDGKLLAAADDSGVRCWELPTGSLAASIQHITHPCGDRYESPGASVEFARDKNILASGWSQPHLRLTDFSKSSATTIDSLDSLNHLESLGIAPDGETLAVASSNADRVYVYDRDPLHLKFELTLQPTDQVLDRIECLSLSPDGKLVAAGARNGDVNIWEYRAGAVPQVLRGHQNVVASVSFGKQGKIVASGDWDGKVVIWDVAKRKSIQNWQLPGRIWRLAFAPDGHHLAISDGSGLVYVVRLQTED